MADQNKPPADAGTAATNLEEFVVDKNVVGPSYRCDYKDKATGRVQSFLFVDIEMIESVQMKRHYLRQRDELGEAGIFAKPGDTIKLPAAIHDLGKENATAVLLRAGVIKPKK